MNKLFLAAATLAALSVPARAADPGFCAEYARDAVRQLGVNNRDLKTFETSLEVCERLKPLIPADKIVVAESGIARHADCVRLAAIGIEAFLVGEALMRGKDVEQSTRALLTGVHG